jgi:hypothetical protein
MNSNSGRERIGWKNFSGAGKFMRIWENGG